jgi:hypothetical protein
MDVGVLCKTRGLASLKEGKPVGLDCRELRAERDVLSSARIWRAL